MKPFNFNALLSQNDGSAVFLKDLHHKALKYFLNCAKMAIFRFFVKPVKNLYFVFWWENT